MSDPRPETGPSNWLRSGAKLLGAASLAILISLLAFAVSSPTPAPAQAPKRTGAPVPSYAADIQPIFNKRCVACHGCLGSPCNLKLTSFRGVERGGFGQHPYSSHILSSPRTGMDVVQTTAEWRARGFFPVLSRGGTRLENQYLSLLYQMVETGTRHNSPGFSRQTLMPLYAKRYAHQCPATPDALRAQLKQNPAAGMPFGLPALDEKDFRTLRNWVRAGSPGPTEAELRAAATPNNPAAVLAWESFFNTADKRSQLVARYIFDHVFLATIVLDESPGDYFRLVRSKTAPAATPNDTPVPIEVIDTPLPYADPYKYAGVDRVYYRLKKITAPIVQKNHFVWRLKRADIDHLNALFLERDWGDEPGLDAPWGIGNPFLVYQAIPIEARYRFMLRIPS